MKITKPLFIGGGVLGNLVTYEIAMGICATLAWTRAISQADFPDGCHRIGNIRERERQQPIPNANLA